MKSYRLLHVVAFFATVIGFSVQAQTLYNGVGHIPVAYQERWNRAGLLQDMSAVEPKLVINNNAAFWSKMPQFGRNG